MGKEGEELKKSSLSITNPVLKMHVYMSEKLCANSHKSGWHGYYSSMHFCGRISDELGELRRAIKKKASPDEVWKEAADVANFAMMVADCYEGGMEYE